MFVTRSLSALALSVALSAIPAHAATMDLFTFTSPQITGPLTVTLLASPTPDSFVPNTSFTVTASANFEGTTLTGPITFLNSGGASGGGTTFTGPILFSGPDANPTFLLGTFNLRGNADLGNGGIQAVTGVLNITQVGSTPPVPEPETLALTGTAVFGLIGYLRRRHRVRTSDVCC
jgi:PEP-CTERM motif